jgi:hypothetical protein
MAHALDFVDGILGNNGIGSYRVQGRLPFVDQDEYGNYIYDDGLAVLNRNGLGGSINHGQYGGDNSDTEVFADMVVGWKYGFWGDGDLGRLRALFMQSSMTHLLWEYGL